MIKSSPIIRLMIIIHEGFLIIFQFLLGSVLKVYTLLKYKQRYDMPKNVKKLKPPYLVLADHVHTMDPFFHGLGLRPVIHWVAADANFRNPFMKFALTFIAGAVAKSKNRSDMVTLTKLRRLVESGCVIGIYQEGERSWDGIGLPPVPGTDKLIRFLKKPVVYCHLEGAYLDQPRWSWSSNRAQITVRYELMISQDEIEHMSLSEIGERLKKVSFYNDWEYKEKGLLPFRGEKRAENIELVCFLCPQCLSVNTLSSQGNELICSCCFLHTTLDRYGRFDWVKADFSSIDTPPFPTVREWNLWQESFYREKTKSLNPVQAGKILFWEDRESVTLTRGKRKGVLKNIGTGSARFYGDRIEFSGKQHLVLPLEEISSFSVFKQYYTEFYYNKQLHRFTFTNRSVSGYKWLLLFRILLEDRAKKK